MCERRCLYCQQVFQPARSRPQRLVCGHPRASGNAGAIINGTSSLPIRFTRRFAETVRRSDVRCAVFEGGLRGDAFLRKIGQRRDLPQSG